MKKYVANYINLKTGNSYTYYLEAGNIKSAKKLAQRAKDFTNNRRYTTFVTRKKD